MRYDANPISGIPTVVKNLLIINGLMFLLKAAHPLGLHPDQLDNLLGLHYPTSPLFKPWQLLTHMFMHADIMHILLNMFALFMLGPRVEYRWGSKRFLIYYLLCGLGAGIIYLGWETHAVSEAMASVSPEALVDIKARVIQTARDGAGAEPADPAAKEVYDLFLTPMVGASGAIFGVLLAFGMLYPNVELMTFIGFLPIPMKAKWFVIIYGAMELLAGVQNNPFDHTAHFAHLGGMLIGFFLVRHWERRHNFY